MALNKAVKIGGSYYKGFELLVSAATGDYVLDMSLAVSSHINSVSFTPDTYGAGDTMSLKHLSAGGATLATIAETIYNPGAGMAVSLDFPAFEPMLPNEKLRLTYTNTAGKAVAVHTIVEYIGIV